MRISIGGSIGSGKSTILQKLKDDGYNVFFEPIDDWKHISKFYSDKKRWSFTFQIEVLNSFTQCTNNGLVICERSPWESYNIFSKMLVDSGDMTADEYELYDKVYKTIAWKPDLFIYLQTTPETCFERIKKRNRSCENNIDMSYLKNLNCLYDGLYTRSAVCVDANRDVDDVYAEITTILEKSRRAS